MPVCAFVTVHDSLAILAEAAVGEQWLIDMLDKVPGTA